MLKIEITGETPLEVLASLTAFGMHCAANKTVTAAADHILASELVKEKTKAGATAPSDISVPFIRSGSPTEPYVEDPPYSGPTPEPEPKEGGDPGGDTAAEQEGGPEPIPTPEEVRKAGIDAAKVHGQPAVKKILNDFGVGGMTALAEKDRAAFLRALKGLGEGDA